MSAGTERLHQEAPDYAGQISDKTAMQDPAGAIQNLMAQKAQSDQLNRKLTERISKVEQERDDAVKIAKDLAPYQDIIQDSRTFLPVYLRRAVTWKRFLGKLRILYGPLVDINQDSKTGRKAAHLRIDAAVEEVLEYAILTWHNVVGRLEVRDANE